MIKPQINYVALRGYVETRNFLSEKIREIISSESVVLDAGCGKSNQLISHLDVWELVGVDIDKNKIERNCKITRGVVADLHSFVFPENYFDGIISYDVIEHLEKPDLFLARAIKYLKPGGFVFLVIPNRNSLFGLVGSNSSLEVKRRLLSVFNAKSDNEAHYYRANTVNSLNKLLQDSGCSGLQFTVMNKLTGNKRLRIISWPYFQLCRLGMLKRFGGSLLCIAWKK